MEDAGPRAVRWFVGLSLVVGCAILGLLLRGGPRDPALPLHRLVGTGPEEPDVAGGGLDRRRAPLDVVGPFRCRGPRVPEWIRGDRRLRDRTRDPTPAAVGLAGRLRERRRIRTDRPVDRPDAGAVNGGRGLRTRLPLEARDLRRVYRPMAMVSKRVTMLRAIAPSTIAKTAKTTTRIR